MTSLSRMNALAAVVIFAASTLSPQTQTAVARAAQGSGQLVLRVDAAKSTVHWSVESSLHTVHGTFHVKRGDVSLDPATGKASGEIVVDAASGESGNDSRDRRMHQEILESARFSDITFRPDRVDGAISKTGNSSVTIHGVFSLHGAEHEFSAPAQAELSANAWKGSATIRVPYIDWKLKNPSNFLLKVKPVVEVQVELAGPIQPDTN